MEPTGQETIKVEGSQLIDQVKRLIHEGNVRRIVIRQGGQTVVELPLTFGVVAAVLAPTLAAVGALAALITDCTILVERVSTRVDRSWAADEAAPGESGSGQDRSAELLPDEPELGVGD